MLRGLLLATLLIPATLVVWLALGVAEPRADFVYAAEESRTLDPHRVSWLSEIQIAAAMFLGLTELDPRTLAPRPAVARGWTCSDDQRHWTFTLDPAAHWSDGAPLTAEDFRWSWLRALTPATKSQYFELLFVIAGARRYYESRADRDDSNDAPAESVGVVARDAHTLEVTLAAPCPFFLQLTSFVTLAPLPRQAIKRAAAAGAEPLWTRPERIVCNGDYVMKRWEFKRRILLERNPQRPPRDPQQPHTIEVYTTSSTQAALLAYETGRVDLVRGLGTALAARLAARHAGGQRPDFHVGERYSTYFYRINCSRPPLDNVELRRALYLAIDRERLCAAVTGLGERPAYHFVPEISAGGAPAPAYHPPRGLGATLEVSERLAQARACYQRSGFAAQAGGRPLELLFASDNPDYQRVAEALQAQWTEALGVRITLRPIEGKVLSSRVRNLDYDLARADWFGDYLDPSTFLNMFTTGNGQNRTGWSNREYDALIARAANEPDPSRRLALLQAAERILCVTETPIVPLYFRRGNFLLNPRFEGLHDNLREYLPLHHVRRAARPRRHESGRRVAREEPDEN